MVEIYKVLRRAGVVRVDFSEKYPTGPADVLIRVRVVLLDWKDVALIDS